jgi:hypothetical protein
MPKFNSHHDCFWYTMLIFHPLATTISVSGNSSMPTGTPAKGAALCGIHGLPAEDYFLGLYYEQSPNVPVTTIGCYEICMVRSIPIPQAISSRSIPITVVLIIDRHFRHRLLVLRVLHRASEWRLPLRPLWCRCIGEHRYHQE